MSIREQFEANRQGNIPVSEKNATDTNLVLPSCTIEDIDRAVFDLFNRDMPMLYTYKKETKRVPVVFASGERFALIARKKPLRDKTGALILPIVAIMRSGLSIDNEMGLSSNVVVPHIIKKRLSRKDARYQRLLNKVGLKNSDDLATDEAFLNDGMANPRKDASPGRLATRRSQPQLHDKIRAGKLLDPDLGDNIYEVIEMPPPIFITATYGVTIWAQYVTQMNDITMAIMTNSLVKTFRLESQKGYTFVAYMDPGFDPSNNFDDYTDDERIIRTSFTLKVPGYLLGGTYPGAPIRLRSILSLPQVTFEMNMTPANILDEISVGTASGDPGDYVLDDSRQIFSPLPGGAVAAQKAITHNDPRALGASTLDEDNSAMLGDAVNDLRERTIASIVDPFTGRLTRNIGVVKTRTNRKGETIYREIL